jgi:hypothetical protein
MVTTFLGRKTPLPTKLSGGAAGEGNVGIRTTPFYSI